MTNAPLSTLLEYLTLAPGIDFDENLAPVLKDVNKPSKVGISLRKNSNLSSNSQAAPQSAEAAAA